MVDDLTPFLRRFGDDPLIGPSVRTAPWRRPYRRSLPFEVLLGAICEQLITGGRAADIKRQILLHHGRSHGGLRDGPGPEQVARLVPAELELFAPYAPWRGVAGWHLLRAARSGALRRRR